MRQWTEDAIEKAENVVYLAVAVVLVVVAAVVLGASVAKVAELPDLGVITVAAEVLDLLLLVFIVVELLYAVRTTLAERELLAEPFLIVGIIASIKEIVVLSVKAPDYVGTDKLDDTVWLMGVLTVTIGVLAIAALVLRRKEREPSEGDGGGPDSAHEKQAGEPAGAS
jgi:uncharacterized membrane protein (DUF373 family)